MPNRVIAITGGNSGIGLAISELFLAQGDHIAVFAQSTDSLTKLEHTSPEHVLTYAGDVSKISDLTQFYQQCEQRWGGIDVIIANAGIAAPINIVDVDEHSFDQTININLKGVFFTVQKSLPYLRPNASITLISSIQAQRGAGIWSVYGASKAAVRSLARSFAQQFGPQGIRVNCLSPGVTDTPILDKFGFDNGTLTSIIEQVSEQTPLGRIGQADEIAQAALFLASDAASFMTGADMQVDGGLAQI